MYFTFFTTIRKLKTAHIYVCRVKLYTQTDAFNPTDFIEYYVIRAKLSDLIVAMK